MTKRSVLSAAVALGITLSALSGGLASADGGVGVGQLQEPNITKSMDHSGSGDVDGRDFLVWQRGGNQAANGSFAAKQQRVQRTDGSIPTESISFNFDKMH